MEKHLRVLFVLFTFRLSAALKIIPDSSELILTKDASLTLTCSDKDPVLWSHQHSESDRIIVESQHENDTYFSNLTINSAHYLDTGYFICQLAGDASKTAKIYIYVFDQTNLIALNDSKIIHAEVDENIEIPCKPTSPDVNITLTGFNSESKGLKYDPKVGYVASNVEVVDSGIVICEASYNNQSSFRMIEIIVNPSESKTWDPYIDVTNLNHLVEGDTATLNCSITASIEVRTGVHWKLPNERIQKEKIIIQNNQEIIHNQHKTLFRILTIKNLTKSDEGPYICEFRDHHSVIKSTTHFLEIHKQNSTFLNITVQQESRRIIVKSGEQQIKWVVKVIAHPKPTIKWFNMKGAEIKSAVNSSTTKYVITNEGIVTKLQVKNINIWDFGTYKMTASNPYHKETVDFVLEVESKPYLELKNEHKLLLLDNTYSIDCFLSGYPLPKVSWFIKNCNDYPSCEENTYQRVEASNYKEFAIKSYLMKSTLNLIFDRSKIVRCEAENTMGSSNASSSFLVTDIENGFAIKKNFSRIAVQDDVQITCAVSKYIYHDNVTWYLNKLNKMVPAKYLRGIQIRNIRSNFSYETTLQILNIQKHHSGNYVCAVSPNNSSLSDVEEKDVFVDVKDIQKPTVVNTNLNGSTWRVQTGKLVKMKTQVDGIPSPDVIWLKDGKPVLAKPHQSRILLQDNNQTLLIKYATLNDEGVYSWIATNKAGNISANLSLLLTDKPESQEHLEVKIGFLILTIFFIVCISWSIVKIRKEQSFRKELKKIGLSYFEEGAIHSLNPDLGIEQQAELLPYNKKWEFPKEKLKLGKVLGSGAFGEVRIAEADGIVDGNAVTTVAVKTVKHNADAMSIKALISELKIMIHLGPHLNVVNLLGACTKNIDKRELAVIVEFCQYGNLHDFLLKQRNNFISQINDEGEIDLSISIVNNNNYWLVDTKTNNQHFSKIKKAIGSNGYLLSVDDKPKLYCTKQYDHENTIVGPIKTSDLICWSFQVARGMEYLAFRKILHGDLAARNILLAKNNIVKICDFGLAKSMYQSENYRRKGNTLLPVKWMALESIRDGVFSTHSDVWSFGVTMWELFSLSVSPYPGIENLDDLYGKLISGYRLEKPSFASRKIYDIMKECWLPNPKSRPTFAALSRILENLFENGIPSYYSELNEMYMKMNNAANDTEDYLSIINPFYHSFGENRYVNVMFAPRSNNDVQIELTTR